MPRFDVAQSNINYYLANIGLPKNKMFNLSYLTLQQQIISHQKSLKLSISVETSE